MVNKAIILGRLTKDPEIKNTQQGLSVVKMNVATSEVVKGEKKSEFHLITVFGKTAENCEKYLKKGSQVYIEGKLKTNSWEKDGQKHYTTEIIASTVQFIGAKAQDSENTKPDTKAANFGGVDYDSTVVEIPF